jgi:hypothetical protein
MKLAWSVILFSSLSPAVAGEPKPAAPTPAQMVDAIVNRNQPPKLLERRGLPRNVALFPQGYDWQEEKRVHEALARLYQDTTAELWEELVRRTNDPSYCIVVVSQQSEASVIRSVGSICRELAADRLHDVYRQHLPGDPKRFEGRTVILPMASFKGGLADWRKERKDRSLYQLQIEACEEAIKELAQVESVPQRDKDRARRKIEFEIETMRSTKQPLIGKDHLYTGYYAPLYTQRLAEEIRRAVESGSELPIIVK